MALEQNILAAQRFFMSEDKKLRFKVAGEDGVTPIDVAGMDFVWAMAEDPADAVPKVQKTSQAAEIVVGGVFNEDPDLNTQYVEVSIVAEDTAPLYKGKFWYSLRRSDVGSRTVLAFGYIELQQAA